MPGTKAGGRKAAITNKILHGDDFYARIGRKGGSKSSRGGFAANPELARMAGKKGGSASKRGVAQEVRVHERTMMTMRANGYSMADISRTTGLPYYSVTYYFRKLRKI